MPSEPYKVVIEVQQREQLDQLQEAFKKSYKDLADLNAQLKSGAINQAQFNQQAQAIAASAAQMHGQIQKLQASVRGGIFGSGGMGGGMGMGVLEISRGLEDLQYGISAVVNNIPGIVMGLGGSMGIAGMASVAAIAVNQLVSHWDQLKDAMSAAWSGASVEQLTALRERAEEAAAAFKKLAETPTESASKGADSLKKAIVEGGADKIAESVAAAIGGDPTMRAQETKRQMLNRGAIGSNPVEQKLMEDQIKKELQDENRKTAQRLIVEAAKPGEEGRSARQTLARYAKENPAAFPEGFRESITGAQPEAAKAKAEAAKQQELEAQGNENRRKMRREMEEDKKKEREQQATWEMAGRESNKKYVKEREKKGWTDRIEAVHEQIYQNQQAMVDIRMKGQSQTFGSTAAYVSATQEAALSKNAETKELEKANVTLGRIQHQLEKEMKAALGP